VSCVEKSVRFVARWEAKSMLRKLFHCHMSGLADVLRQLFEFEFFSELAIDRSVSGVL
jgi:hypothetical protein